MITLPSSVRVEPGRGGLPRIAVKTRHGVAEVYLHGAHLTAWHPASAAEPVIWLSRESLFETNKPIRGGVPICFPWFGAHPTDPKAPAHGVARLRDWTLIDAREDANGVVSLTLELPADAVPARVTHEIAIGPKLTMALRIQSLNDTPFPYEAALHSYFAVGNVRNATVTGLEHTTYLDKTKGYSRLEQGDEPIHITAETDRIYLAAPTCTIHDPDRRRTITITPSGTRTTVVWNPWIDKARAMSDFGDDEWPEMMCVETCNVNVHAQTLGPGQTHTLSATIETAPKQ